MTSQSVADNSSLGLWLHICGRYRATESHSKQNTETREDDTLMGTDVWSSVINRLMEFGHRCGRDQS